MKRTAASPSRFSPGLSVAFSKGATTQEND